MTAAGSSFERRARRLRRALRRHPALQRLADIGGVPLWRWYLRNRLGAGGTLPEWVEIDPATIGLALPRRAVERRSGAGGPGPVRGGSWDRRAVPLARAEG
ncbi:MAG TPA: hypothetical protein VHM02_13200, partial [Thermoanaerobaculia bacterium]|nr:hypothetical protein [Thermoanaerobaculia bacterium]